MHWRLLLQTSHITDHHEQPQILDGRLRGCILLSHLGKEPPDARVLLELHAVTAETLCLGPLCNIGGGAEVELMQVWPKSSSGR